MIKTIKKITPIAWLYYKLRFIQFSYYYCMAYLGALWYGFPARKLTVIGITGTKGKTSAVEMTAHILRASGIKTASLSSLQISVGSTTIRNKTGNSMPGQFFIQKFLHDAVESGATHAVLEVTSQGVSMYRHKGIRWSYGVLTNLSPEHIQWHGSYHAYRGAKGIFLEAVLDTKGTVFLNPYDGETPYYKKALEKIGKGRITTFTLDAVAEEVGTNPYFTGSFARENAAAAAAIAVACNVPKETITAALRSFVGVAGRFEYVQKTPFAVIVDYAHTPDSLLALYKTIRPTAQKMICVFGAAGGGRDTWKRPKMGELASQFCDHIILTNEDPYDEDPNFILKEIEAGIPTEKRSVVEKILDRTGAIQAALKMATEGDAVVLTGKGSEEVIHGAHGNVVPWNEREVVEELLKK